MSFFQRLFPFLTPAPAEIVQAYAGLNDRITGLEREAARQGREQSRAITLLEGQAGALEELAESWQDHLSQRQRESEDFRQTLADLEGQVALSMVEELLPVADALSQSIEAAHQLRVDLAGAGRATPLDGWLQGLLLVERRLLAVLDSAGVQPMAAVGRPFDPHRHLAVAVARRSGAPDGAVVAEERRGYLVGERVLRHAEVVVARGESVDLGESGNEDDQI